MTCTMWLNNSAFQYNEEWQCVAVGYANVANTYEWSFSLIIRALAILKLITQLIIIRNPQKLEYKLLRNDDYERNMRASSNHPPQSPVGINFASGTDVENATAANPQDQEELEEEIPMDNIYYPVSQQGIILAGGVLFLK